MATTTAARTKSDPKTRAERAEDIKRRHEEREHARTWYRLRRHTVPTRWAYRLLLAMLPVWLIDRLGTQPGFPWLQWNDHSRFGPLLALVVGVVATLGIGIAAVALRKAIARRNRTHALVASIVAAGWVVWAVAFGPSWDAVALLMALTAMVAARYWRRIRIYADSEPLNEVVVDDAPGGPDWPAEWALYVAGKAGPLPNTGLVPYEETEHSSNYILQLDRGKQNLSTVLAQMPLLESALNMEIENLHVEKSPELRPSELLFKVVHTSPLANTSLVFDGPRFENGIAYIGPYADGEGDAPYRLYHEGSMWSGFVVGATGMGKSRLVENLVASVTSDPITYPTCVLFTDPQGGSSSPALQEYALKYGELPEVPNMVEVLALIATAREDENSGQGDTGFTPVPCSCPDPISAMVSGEHRLGCKYRPGILWVVDECHAVFTLRVMGMVLGKAIGGLARQLRKVGIAMLALSQNCDQPTFGGDEALRQSLCTGNAYCMHVTSNITGNMLPDLDLDPRTLPKKPGYLYSVRTADFARTAPARLRDMKDPVTGLYNAPAWLSRNPRLALDPVSAAVAGKWFHDNPAAVRQIREQKRAQTDAVRRGDPDAIEKVQKRARLRIGFATGSGLYVPETAACDLSAWEQELAGMDLEFPDPADYGFPAPRSEPAPLDDTRNTAVDAVYAALLDGHTRMSQLCQETGFSDTHVRNQLRALERAGKATQTGHGQWRAENDPAETVSAEAMVDA